MSLKKCSSSSNIGFFLKEEFAFIQSEKKKEKQGHQVCRKRDAACRELQTKQRQSENLSWNTL
jgi:hypothetical protein